MLYNKINMKLMLRCNLLAVVAGSALLVLPGAVFADTTLTSPSNSASVLQPTPSDSLQTGTNQNSSASAAYLNDQLVGGQQGTQTDDSAAAPSPWGDLLAAAVLAVGLIGLATIAYRGRRRPRQAPVPEPAPKPKVSPKPKAKAKTKSKKKPGAKKKAKK